MKQIDRINFAVKTLEEGGYFFMGRLSLGGRQVRPLAFYSRDGARVGGVGLGTFTELRKSKRIAVKSASYNGEVWGLRQ